MTALGQAVVAGHVCLDVIPRLRTTPPSPGELVDVGPAEIRLGGCVANTGTALASLGVPVELVTVVGTDMFGDAVATMLESTAAAKVTIHRSPAYATSYSIVIQPPGTDRAFLHHVGANAAFRPEQVDLADADLLHVGYPQLLPGLIADHGDRMTALLQHAQASGTTTSVDFATIDTDATSPRPWSSLLRAWAPHIDVLSPSIDDLEPSLGALPVRTPPLAAELAEALVRAGVGIALVTAGELGMALHTSGVERLTHAGRAIAGHAWADRQLWSPSATVTPVRTTGAGDAATAGFLAGLLAGFSPERSLRLATASAALHVTGVDVLPHLSDSHAYDSLALNAMTVDGWIPDELGLLRGPADKERSP